jgi:hypothetical protein
MDLSHQLLHRDTVLVRVEAGGGDVLGHEPISSTVQSAEEAHFPPAQGTLTIDQDPERPSVHFHSPNSATVLSGAALKIHYSPKPSARYRSFRARISVSGPHAAESTIDSQNLARHPAVPGIHQPGDCRNHISGLADSLQRMHRVFVTCNYR